MKSQTQKLVGLTLVLAFVTMGSGFVCAQKAKSSSNGNTTHTANGIVPTHSFENGEELVYVAEFSRALLKKMDVADFRFTAAREKSIDSDAGQDSGGAAYSLKFTGDISSKGFFSKLFNLRFREQVESIVEPASFTVQRTKRTEEQGKRARTSEAVYDRGKVFWTERDPNNPSRTPRTASTSFTGRVQDVLSAIYYLRTQPLVMGKTLELTISDSGRVYQVPVRVVEKKRMKTVLGRVEALRVDAEVYGPNRMIDGEGQFSIWVTNDSRRVPVSARVKTEYGTFDITLRKVIQHPTQREYLTKVKNGDQ
ncbi:MAG: DUF3108 domain-containing protein [Acidobacteriota bacterium]|nr:DUF3108 domain-containing protein [Acidobacteriota bacterium]